MLTASIVVAAGKWLALLAALAVALLGAVVHLPVITTSELKSFRRCPREHRIAYREGIRPAQAAEALRFGTLVHRALEAWWRAGVDRLAAALEALSTAPDVDPYDLARAEALVIGYDARWGGAPLETLAVEVEFRAPLVNPATGAASRTYQIGGKLDAIARDVSTGRTLIVEHKTASASVDLEAGAPYWRRLQLDGQVSMYFAGARALGFEPDACLYDVVAKPAQRPRQIPLVDEQGVRIVVDQAGERVRTKDGKRWRETADTAAGYVVQTRPETVEEYRARLLDAIAEAPEQFYRRGEVVRLADEESDAAHDVWQTARAMREAELAGRAPRNVDACERYGSFCQFFDACTNTASLDDPIRFRRAERAHEELATNATEETAA